MTQSWGDKSVTSSKEEEKGELTPTAFKSGFIFQTKTNPNILYVGDGEPILKQSMAYIVINLPLDPIK